MTPGDWHKSGGPAFPAMEPPVGYERGPNFPQSPGMSLRDYFAAAALPAIMASADELAAHYSKEKVMQLAVASAYNYADAMLAERAK